MVMSSARLMVESLDTPNMLETGKGEGWSSTLPESALAQGDCFGS